MSFISTDINNICCSSFLFVMFHIFLLLSLPLLLKKLFSGCFSRWYKWYFQYCSLFLLDSEHWDIIYCVIISQLTEAHPVSLGYFPGWIQAMSSSLPSVCPGSNVPMLVNHSKLLRALVVPPASGGQCGNWVEVYPLALFSVLEW